MGRREKREKWGGQRRETGHRRLTSLLLLRPRHRAGLEPALSTVLAWLQEERPLEPWKGLCREAAEGSPTAVELHGSSGEQPGEGSRAAKQVTSPSQSLAEQGSKAGLGWVIARGPPL